MEVEKGGEGAPDLMGASPSRIWAREYVGVRAVKHDERKRLAERSVDFTRGGNREEPTTLRP